MQLPIRSLFAAFLWLCAAVPVGLYLVHLDSPATAVQAANSVRRALGWILLGASVAALVAALLYPPFVPAVRIVWRGIKRKLSTDPGPLLEVQARLRNLETAVDHTKAGRLLLDRNRVAESVGHLLRAVELDPNHLGGRYQLGLALMKAGQLPNAIEQLSIVVKHDPEHAFGAAMLELGIALERAGDNEGAIEVLQQHESAYGPNRRNFYYRARAESRRGDRQAASGLLRRAAEPPSDGRKLTPEEDLLRAHARVALLRGGRL